MMFSFVLLAWFGLADTERCLNGLLLECLVISSAEREVLGASGWVSFLFSFDLVRRNGLDDDCCWCCCGIRVGNGSVWMKMRSRWSGWCAIIR